MHTRVTSVMRSPDWQRLPDHVYIGMPGYAGQAVGYFGKPWACLKDPRGWREAYKAHLKERLRSDPDFVLDVAELHGKTLVCFCKGNKRRDNEDCHGDTLAAAAEFIFHAIHDR